MKEKGLLLVLLLAGIAIAGWFAHDSAFPVVDLSEPVTREEAESAASIDTAVSADESAEASETLFEVDRARLYDVSYLTDPQLIAYAESIDRTAECVLVAGREKVSPDTSDDSACFSVSQAQHRIEFTVGGLSDMTDDQLLALAVSDPNANLVLAHRHSSDPEIANRHIERAMALSGKAGPVQMLQATDDVPFLVHAVEVLLTSEELGRHIDPMILANFRHGLTDDLQTLAEERAYRRAEQIKRLRKDLVGEPWGAQNGD